MIDLFKDLLHLILRSVLVLLIPLGLIVGGAALAGLGIDNDWRIVAWIGLGLVAAGIIWGAIILIFSSGMFD